jgi:hypothetical protein
MTMKSTNLNSPYPITPEEQESDELLIRLTYAEDQLSQASQSFIANHYSTMEGQIVKAVKELNRCLKNCRTLDNLRSKKD